MIIVHFVREKGIPTYRQAYQLIICTTHIYTTFDLLCTSIRVHQNRLPEVRGIQISKMGR